MFSVVCDLSPFTVFCFLFRYKVNLTSAKSQKTVKEVKKKNPKMLAFTENGFDPTAFHKRKDLLRQVI